ncbi:MAG: tryptophan synthase subunit alpha [Phycisphaerae bacterium]
MRQRVISAFHDANGVARKVLCPFLVAGYPSVAHSVELLLAAQRGGAGLVELGIPFSDPVADGPVIQAAFTQVLAQKVSIAQALAAVATARQAGLTIPVLAMVSYTLVYRRGVQAFGELCRASGVDGLILPDVPVEEAAEVVKTLAALDLTVTLLVAPSTPAARRTEIAGLCTGFVYYLSVAGITGERQALPPDVAANVQILRGLTTAPICVGFGISTAAQVREVTQVADGAIVGSALVRKVTDWQDTSPVECGRRMQAAVAELALGLAP